MLENWQRVSRFGPSSRFDFKMAYDGTRKRVVGFGGVLGLNAEGKPKAAADTWEWDGVQWQTAGPSGPGQRFAGAMTYDSWRKVVLLVGGAWYEGIQYRNTASTWAWNGSEWRMLAQVGPPAAHGMSIAFDGDRGVALLFGGYIGSTGGDNQFSRETWEWDGKCWTKKSERGPSKRAASAMTYDARRRRVVLFGGHDHAQNGYKDTWEWDGSMWIEKTAKGPEFSTAFGMAYDKETASCWLYGGYDFALRDSLGKPYQETWIWDGQEWTLISASPIVCFWPTMTMNTTDRELVVITGENAMSPLHRDSTGQLETWTAQLK